MKKFNFAKSLLISISMKYDKQFDTNYLSLYLRVEQINMFPLSHIKPYLHKS